MVEHLTFNQRVMGSNPVGLTNKKGHLLRWPFLLVNLHGAEEAIGSERVVGERKLAPREPYGARRTRVAGVPYPVGLTT